MSELPAAILFDADGTLYESERLNYESNRLAAKELHDFEYTWEDFDEHVRSGSKAGYQVLELYELTPDPARFRAARDVHYERLIAEQLKLLPGVVDFLQWCDQQAIRKSVVTAARLSVVTMSLEALHLSDYFEVVVSHDDLAGRVKPDPYPYLLGLEKMGVSASSVLVIEDTPKGIASARAADLRVVGVHNDENTSAELADAEYTFNHYHQLQDYLLQE